MSGAIVLVSGGMDSKVLLKLATIEFDEVIAVSFDYGQRHHKEIGYACLHAIDLGVEHMIVDLTSIGAALDSCLTDKGQSVPHGHYEDESMRATVVPGRNLLMISAAAALAASNGFGSVGIAAHAGDNVVYPDCRPEFLKAAGAALNVFHYTPVSVWAPFQHISKGEVALKGLDLGVDIKDSWSCYEGGAEHCGKCGTCVERFEAIRYASDATVHRDLVL